VDGTELGRGRPVGEGWTDVIQTRRKKTPRESDKSSSRGANRRVSKDSKMNDLCVKVIGGLQVGRARGLRGLAQFTSGECHYNTLT
jgi:hypothetical protein